MRYLPLLPLLCACLCGQAPAPPTRNLAVTRASEAGTATIHLRNAYASAATAWNLQCETPGGGSRYYWNDQDLSFQTTPLAPGEEIEFTIRPRPAAMMQRVSDTSTCDDFRLIAAVFAYGTVSGDLRWIDAILAERRQTCQDIAKANDI